MGKIDKEELFAAQLSPEAHIKEEEKLYDKIETKILNEVHKLLEKETLDVEEIEFLVRIKGRLESKINVEKFRLENRKEKSDSALNSAISSVANYASGSIYSNALILKDLSDSLGKEKNERND